MNKYSIRKQVALLTMTPLLVMAVCLEAFFLHDSFSVMDHDLMERGKLISRQLASSAEYGVFSNNRGFLQNLATYTLQQPDVRGVIILDSGVGFFVEVGEFSGVPKKPAPEIASVQTREDQSRIVQFKDILEAVNLQEPASLDRESLRLFQPIVAAQVALDEQGTLSEANQIGEVIVEMSLEGTNGRKQRMLWVTVGSTVLFLIFPMSLIFLGSRSIVTPIRRLSDVVEALGNGDLDARAPVAQNIIELETLSKGLNDMADKLQKANMTLQQRMDQAMNIAAIAFESHEGMMIVGSDCRIMRVNKAFTRMTGYTQEEAIGQNPHMLNSGRHDADFFREMWETINETGVWHGEIWNRRKDGEVYPAMVNITAVSRDVPERACYIATYTDITHKKVAEEEIKNLAFNDALTQLPNRRVLIDRLNQTMAVSKRTKHYSALMFIDLDNFKPLNDKYGHEVGDLLLVEVAKRLVCCVREVDTVARFGGDEFVVMLSELNIKKEESIFHAEIVAEKIRAILAEPYLLEIRKNGKVSTTLEYRCTSSIGVRMFLGHQSNADEVIKRADLAMYRAKREGSNSVRFCEMD